MHFNPRKSYSTGMISSLCQQLHPTANGKQKLHVFMHSTIKRALINVEMLHKLNIPTHPTSRCMFKDLFFIPNTPTTEKHTVTACTVHVIYKRIWPIKQQWDHPVLIFHCVRSCATPHPTPQNCRRRSSTLHPVLNACVIHVQLVW